MPFGSTERLYWRGGGETAACTGSSKPRAPTSRANRSGAHRRRVTRIFRLSMKALRAASRSAGGVRLFCGEPGKAGFERLDPLLQFRQATEHHRGLPPLVGVDGGIA